MWSSPVVEVEIATDRDSRLGDRFVGSQIDLLVFDAFPQPLNEHSQGWRTFLHNHAPDIAAMDLFVVRTIGFDLLYAFVIVRLDRRDLVGNSDIELLTVRSAAIS